MAKERKQDLNGPEEDALEKHVREMMDITVPDPPEESASVPEAKKPTSIKVIDHTDTAAEAKRDDVAEAIAAANEAIVQQSATAPLVPKKTTAKKVTVTHLDDEESQPQPVAVSKETVEEVQPEEPLLETEPTETETASPTPEVQTIQDAIDAATEESGEDASPLEADLESPATEQAVSEIIAQESDELLAVQDTKTKPKDSKPKEHRVRRFFSAWVHSSAARWATFLTIFAVAVGVGAVPDSRYYILNAFGARSSASVVVSDASTLRPLKNVTVTLAGESVQTDSSGKAQLYNLRLGKTELAVAKRAYGNEKRQVTVGWGSNPLGDVTLVPQGQQYTFVITDMFSGKPIANAEISAGEASASSGNDGVIKLAVEDTDAATMQLTLKAEGYRDEVLTLDLNNKAEVPVAMTPSKKVAFVSKRSGKYDVYTIDADGKNEKLILPGTGNESHDLAFATHPTADRAVLVSTRDGKRADDGSLLYSLLSVNVADGTSKTITEASQIRLVDWIDNRMIYVQLTPGMAAEDPSRYKLMSYDFTSGDNRQLAATNYFNDVLVADSKVYFAPASAYQNGVNVGVFVVDADGNNKKPIFDQEAWNIYRTAYDRIVMAVQQDWYEYVFGSDKAQKLGGQPTNTISRVYTNSPDGTKSIWVDNRDGKGTLIAYNTKDKSDTTLYAQSGIKGTVRWLNNTTFVYRIVSDAESADYVMSTQGGEPRKLTNVTDTSGVGQWSF